MTCVPQAGGHIEAVLFVAPSRDGYRGAAGGLHENMTKLSNCILMTLASPLNHNSTQVDKHIVGGFHGRWIYPFNVIVISGRAWDNARDGLCA